MYKQIQEESEVQEGSLQYYQLPNGMSDKGLLPTEQLIYVVLRSYDFYHQGKAFPSHKTLSKSLNCSKTTIQSAIRRLEELGYIEIKKNKGRNEYIFLKYDHFEPFSPEFLYNKEIPFKVKAYIVALQQHMFKDTTGLGRVAYTIREIANLLHISAASVSRYNTFLKEKNCLTIQKDEIVPSKDVLIFHLQTLGQAIIWKLQDLDRKVTKGDERTAQLEEAVRELTKRIEDLEADKSTKEAPKEFIV